MLIAILNNFTFFNIAYMVTNIHYPIKSNIKLTSFSTGESTFTVRTLLFAVNKLRGIIILVSSFI